jgi:hypothetical protein
MHVNRMLYGGSRGYGIAVTSFATAVNQDVSELALKREAL